VLQSSAGAEQSLGRVYFGSGDPRLAAEHLRPAADISRRIVDIPGADVATIAQAASVVDSLGDVYGQEGAVTLDDPTAAIAAYEQAQAIDARGLRPRRRCARCRRGVALEYWKIGMLLEASGSRSKRRHRMRRGLDDVGPSSLPRIRRPTRVRQARYRDPAAPGKLCSSPPDAGPQGIHHVERRPDGAFARRSDADPTDARARDSISRRSTPALPMATAIWVERQGGTRGGPRISETP
jgi:hypothetical protein